MRRIALIGALLVAAVVGIVIVNNASAGGDPYLVRAIFDNAAVAVQGEDVRIAGANVGSIDSLSVTKGNQAAVTIEIDNSDFTPFHANATCAIRPQSLIGEKYIDCTPGTSSHPALTKINHGPGAGSYYLPVTQTSSPIDTDIVQDIYRDPVRQQFAIILNELGTGLAARGSDLNAVIRRADPALRYTQQFVQILAKQNRQLAQLAKDSDTVLTPLARDRSEISSFVVHANTTSVASAARATDIARSFQLLPSFLRQLRPLMADLGTLADQATPVQASLAQAAPALARQYTNLAPFARIARKALISLGAAAQQQQPALVATIPLARQLLALGNAGVPSFTSLDKLTSSLEKTGAIQQLMGVLFYGTAATNGFDTAGHFVRTEALVGSCTAYVKTTVPGCSANFTQAKAEGDTASAASAGSGNARASRAHGGGRAPESPKVARLVRAAHAAGARSTSGTSLGGLLRYLIGSPK